MSFAKLCGQWTGTNPITTNSPVGIGISSPTRLLEILRKESSISIPNVMLQLTNSYSGTGMNEPTIRFDNGNGGTYWDIGANVAGQEYFRISYNGWQSGGVQQNLLFINGDGKIVMGDVSTPNGYRLYVQDGILTERLKVALHLTTDWADYVFDKEYKLMTLDSVQEFIENNHFLPNMPSACELVDNGGIDVREMLNLQQAKIEELFLHIIELNRNLAEQNKIIQQLTNNK